MERYLISLGTSAGGKVISASSCCSIDCIPVALEGDAVGGIAPSTEAASKRHAVQTKALGEEAKQMPLLAPHLLD